MTRRTGATKQRMTKEVAQRPSDRGALSFGYFSLCKQRKVTRPLGRNTKLKIKNPIDLRQQFK
jgi:hypothetical protein